MYSLLQQKLNGDCIHLNHNFHPEDYVNVDLFHFMILTWKFQLQQSRSMQDTFILKHMQTFSKYNLRYDRPQTRHGSCPVQPNQMRAFHQRDLSYQRQVPRASQSIQMRAFELENLMTRVIEAGCYEAGCWIAEELLKGLYMT